MELTYEVNDKGAVFNILNNPSTGASLAATVRAKKVLNSTLITCSTILSARKPPPECCLSSKGSKPVELGGHILNNSSTGASLAAAVRAKKVPPFHQQPEVNYLPRFSPQLISLEE